MDSFGARIGGEMKAVELVDMLGAQRNRPGIIERQRELLLVAQMTHQKRRPAVDETLGQSFMQRVGEAILDGAGFGLPARGITSPALPVRGVSPGSDLREAA